LNNKIKHLPNGDFEVIYDNPLEEAEDTKKPDESLTEYMKQAQELWNDSCTAPRKK
jgi:hypothetical protein